MQDSPQNFLINVQLLILAPKDNQIQQSYSHNKMLLISLQVQLKTKMVNKFNAILYVKYARKGVDVFHVL